MSSRGVRLQSLVVVLGSVLTGVAAGVFIERNRSAADDIPQATERTRSERDSSRRGRRGFGPFPRAFESLELTAEQRVTIDSIFQAWQPKTRAAMNEVFPRIEALRDSVRMEVDAVLTPEQRQQLLESMPMERRNGRPPLRNRRPNP